MGTSGNTSQNQPTISVLAPLMSAIFAGIVSIVIRVTSRVAAYRTRRYSVSIKQAIFILGHRPSIATSSANKVFHYGVSFAPSPFSAASSVDASSPGRSATSSLNAAWIFSPSASCALLSAAFVFTYLANPLFSPVARPVFYPSASASLKIFLTPSNIFPPPMDLSCFVMLGAAAPDAFSSSPISFPLVFIFSSFLLHE